MTAHIVTRHTSYPGDGREEHRDTTVPEFDDVILVTDSGEEVHVSVEGETIRLYYEGRVLVTVPASMNTARLIPIPRRAKMTLRDLGLV